MASGTPTKPRRRRAKKSKNEPLSPPPISFLAPDWPKGLLEASSRGDLPVLKQAARMPDDRRGLAATIRDVKNELGRGAFHLAAIGGQKEVCKYLVEEIKLDINSLSDKDETPIYLATLYGKHETATYLFHHGANPAIQNKSGITPLHHATGKGS